MRTQIELPKALFLSALCELCGKIFFKIINVFHVKRTHIKTPLSDDDVSRLKIGDKVLISGVIYTARDAAHKRLIALIDEGKELPFNVQNQILYYVGPSPARPGMPIGSCGPTTSCRMDVYTPKLLERGLKATIGKGNRSELVIEAMKRYKSVYFAATGGGSPIVRCSKRRWT